MHLLKRIGFYLVGVTLGLPIVIFMWKGKKATFEYGPNARTLKTIRIKKRVFSDKAKQVMLKNDIDSTEITEILKTGDVNFGKSKPRKKPCAEYSVSSEKIELYIIRCDSVATIKDVYLK